MAVIRSKWLIGAAVVLVVAGCGFGAARILAQQPPMAVPGGDVPQAPLATPGTNPFAMMGEDPAEKIPFFDAPRGPVRVVRVRSADQFINYLYFTSTDKRTYHVEIPEELTREPRTRDEWITLFAAYGRDPEADADTRALQGYPLTDRYTIWMTARVATQSIVVSTIREKFGRKVQTMNLWSAVHREARDNNDMVKARAAWRVISNTKYDIRIALDELAKEKLELGKLLVEAEQYEPARQQFIQTASLEVWPHSAEAIAKLRAIEGAAPIPAQFTNASAVGSQWISQSQLYEAAVRAAQTSP